MIFHHLCYKLGNSENKKGYILGLGIIDPLYRLFSGKSPGIDRRSRREVIYCHKYTCLGSMGVRYDTGFRSDRDVPKTRGLSKRIKICKNDASSRYGNIFRDTASSIYRWNIRYISDKSSGLSSLAFCYIGSRGDISALSQYENRR